MSHDIATLASATDTVRDAAVNLANLFLPVLQAKRGRGVMIEALALQLGIPPATLTRKFYQYRKQGMPGLIDGRSRASRRIGMSRHDRNLVKEWCERYQRESCNDTAIRALREAWKKGEVLTATKIDAETGYPRGWHSRNLQRHAPSKFELKAARIGRSAAAAHRPLVYTTRRNLYVGQFYLFDDIWHDHSVNLLDTRQCGRPLEFHGIDLSSACKIGWGMRVRREVDGVNESLKTADFRFLLASILTSDGFHPDGTTLVIEWGATALSEILERILHDATGGAIKVARSGMEGAAAHAGHFAGRSKGNFRFKAALESLGNLIHNEFAALPGQTGKDRQHSPEQLHGALKYNDALLLAVSQLPPERMQWIHWPFCSFTQFQLIAQEVYARLNARTEHDLEGWDERMVPCARTGKMRRMSPEEFWRPRRRQLRPIAPEITALILGSEGGVERVTRNGMIQLRDAEISGDVIRFDATDLRDREKFLTVLNPFDTHSLTCFDAKGRYIATLPRLHSVCRGDAEAVQRACGQAVKTEAKLLAPLRARAMQQARAKQAMHQNNARVLDTARDFTPEEKAASRERRAQTVPADAFLDKTEPAPPGANIASMEDFL